MGRCLCCAVWPPACPTEQSLLLHDSHASGGMPTGLLLVSGAQHGFTAEQEAVARPVVDEFRAARLK